MNTLLQIRSCTKDWEEIRTDRCLHRKCVLKSLNVFRGIWKSSRTSLMCALTLSSQVHCSLLAMNYHISNKYSLSLCYLLWIILVTLDTASIWVLIIGFKYQIKYWFVGCCFFNDCYFNSVPFLTYGVINKIKCTVTIYGKHSTSSLSSFYLVPFPLLWDCSPLSMREHLHPQKSSLSVRVRKE